MGKPQPINSVARNTLYIYPRPVVSRFSDASAVTEITRSYEPPAFATLSEGSDVTPEIFCGAIVLRREGLRHRISVERFKWVRFGDETAARIALLSLWPMIEALESIAEVKEVIAQWKDQVGR
jgi:hypothetical protein